MERGIGSDRSRPLPPRPRRPGATGVTGVTAFVLAALGAAVASAGCGANASDLLASGVTDPDLLRSATWDLVEIEREDGTIEPVPGGDAGFPSLVFTEEARGEGLEFGGDGGCNEGGGTYRADDDGDLEILELVATDKLCLVPEVMEVEEAFFDALAAAHTYGVTPDRLAIAFPGGVIFMEAAD